MASIFKIPPVTDILQNLKAKRWSIVGNDFFAGLVVFLVALPLCLGIALASNAPIVSGLLAGIVGGLLVGALSGSHTSVSGPAAGLTAILIAQINILGSFEALLVAIIIAGAIQIVFGLLRLGFLASFFPSSVINGLLSAIGLILILKQIPHLFGYDNDFEGEMGFYQPDHETTFSELARMISNIHYGAAIIGLLSVIVLMLWSKHKILKNSRVPSALIIVVFGLIATSIFSYLGAPFMIMSEHLIQIPLISDIHAIKNLFTWPDFSSFGNPRVYIAGLTIALVASLETLLNVEAVDRLDPWQRKSPPNRELLAQGIGNLILGLVGGLPVTSVIVRSSANINAQAKTKLATIFHGFLLLVSVLFLPSLLNSIPLSCLAAILIMTGLKLSSPKIIKNMWSKGWNQFIPFLATIVGILFTDLLLGILIGLLFSLCFILHNSLRFSMSIHKEKHLEGDITRIILADQVTFLNKPSIERALYSLPANEKVIIDATDTNFIDPDVQMLLSELKDSLAASKNISISFIGFRQKYDIEDQILYADYTTWELQKSLGPQAVISAMQDGNERFQKGQKLRRDFSRQVHATSQGQYPLAAVLSCMDSRTPTEIIFDQGIGDIFSVRMAGNVVSEKVLGSLEFACKIAGAKLIVVMGHTKCGAISASLDLFHSKNTAKEAYGCSHLDRIVEEIHHTLRTMNCSDIPDRGDKNYDDFISLLTRENIMQSIDAIKRDSHILEKLWLLGTIDIVGCLYDVKSGRVEFLASKASLGEPHPTSDPLSTTHTETVMV